jgi:hypothetical protein
MAERVSIFEEDEGDLDLSGFSPSARVRGGDRAVLREAAASKGFTQREVPAAASEPVPIPIESLAPVRRYRTGRNRQLNLKVTEEVAQRFYALADHHELILGDAFARAVMALERELSGT